MRSDLAKSKEILCKITRFYLSFCKIRPLKRIMKIIELAGTNGAGKDTLGEILAKYHGFIFITVSDFRREEAKKRGLKPEREPLRQISAEWRRKKGLGV